jgi:hypothetical protein
MNAELFCETLGGATDTFTFREKIIMDNTKTKNYRQGRLTRNQPQSGSLQLQRIHDVKIHQLANEVAASPFARK